MSYFPLLIFLCLAAVGGMSYLTYYLFTQNSEYWIYAAIGTVVVILISVAICMSEYTYYKREKEGPDNYCAALKNENDYGMKFADWEDKMKYYRGIYNLPSAQKDQCDVEYILELLGDEDKKDPELSESVRAIFGEQGSSLTLDRKLDMFIKERARFVNRKAREMEMVINEALINRQSFVEIARLHYDLYKWVTLHRSSMNDNDFVEMSRFLEHVKKQINERVKMEKDMIEKEKIGVEKEIEKNMSMGRKVRKVRKVVGKNRL